MVKSVSFNLNPNNINEPLCRRCGSYRVRLRGKHKGYLECQCQDCYNYFLASPGIPFASRFVPKHVSLKQVYKSGAWDVRAFGLRENSDGRCVLNFSAITPLWLKDGAKQWLKYRLELNIDATSTIFSRFDSICYFSRFIKSRYSGLQPQYINRDLVGDFFSYLLLQIPCEEKQKEYLGNLGQFLECCARFSWIEVPLERLIFLEDFAKETKVLDSFIPDGVIKQLDDNLDALPETVACMVKVLRETGIRLTELCNLEFDCLSQDAIGNWWLDIYKIDISRKSTAITISQELATAIKRQQQYLRDNFGSDFFYLFCETKGYTWFSKYAYQQPPKGSKRLEIKHFVPRPTQLHWETLRGYLYQLAHEREIRDASGKIYSLGMFYQLSRTDRTDLINAGGTQQIIQKPSEMTSVDTHIPESTMKREMEKLWDGQVVNIKGEEIKSLSNLYTPEMQCFKKNIKSQELFNGWCLLPIYLSCQMQGIPCINCKHFATSKKFLLVLKKQLKNIEKLIEEAENNGWQRQIETNKVIAENLRKMISSLEGNG